MSTTVPPRAHVRRVTETDPGWDDARQAFNLLVDQRPAEIVLPTDARQVAGAVRDARSRGLRVAPQGTGHGAGAFHTLTDTVIVNTSSLTDVTVDVAARRVRVGAGARWLHVVPALSRAGLACLHGSSAHVGIAGYSLGGGMGWLARRYGLQANSVTAVEIVTGDGDIRRIDADHEPDLFWAVRGGGGNFGVVTAIEFQVYPLPSVYQGAFFYPFARAGEVLHTWRTLLPDLPDEMMTWASIMHFPDDPAVPDDMRGVSFTIIMGAWLGPERLGRDLLSPLRRLGPVADTFATTPPAGLTDLAMEDPAEPLPFLIDHHLLGRLPAEGIDALLAAAGPEARSDGLPTVVQLRQMGGALARHTPGAGARATLPGELSLLSLAVVDGSVPTEVVRESLDAVHRAALPYRVGAYPNFVEHPVDASVFFDPDTWARLRRVKALYDPADTFRGNHRIPPAE